MAVLLEREFPVEAGAFTTAGEASTTIKRTLKQLGVNAEVLRRVSVACYEVELNLVIHSLGGTLTLLVDPEKVTLISKDVGPGIPTKERLPFSREPGYEEDSVGLECTPSGINKHGGREHRSSSHR